MQDNRWPTYGPRGIVLDAAEPADGTGSMVLRDTEGRRYLDAISGIGCAPLGHAHPAWVAAITQQLGKLSTAANTFWTVPQQQLATRLGELFPIREARAFLCNSGTEATEAAIKLVLRATGRRTIVAFERAFHGRTLGAIALTANPVYRDPYVNCPGESHPERFANVSVLRAPFGDLDAVKALFADHGPEIAAVFIEPIQGEAGIYPATREFLVGLHGLCRDHGALLGLDEIQTGCGRTGHWSAWSAIVGDDPALEPDLIWLAKALGGSFPIGACLTRRELADAMARGSHGTTFGGNPLACVAAMATLRVLEEEDLLSRAARQIEIVRDLAKREPIERVAEIRGHGAMIGIQIAPTDAGDDKPAAALGPKLQDDGVLVTICGGHTVRWLFPYAAGADELTRAWRALAGVLQSA